MKSLHTPLHCTQIASKDISACAPSLLRTCLGLWYRFHFLCLTRKTSLLSFFLIILTQDHIFVLSLLLVLRELIADDLTKLLQLQGGNYLRPMLTHYHISFLSLLLVCRAMAT
jgi:hypothetical protein